MSDPVAAGRGVGKRLRDLSDALGRYDRFVFDGPPRDVAQPPRDHDVAAAARSLVLRALRAASDPVGWQLLQRLRDGDATTAELAAALDCCRVIAWDQVDQLVQVGLVGRDLDHDLVGITPAGAALVGFVDAATAAAVEEVRR